MHLTLSGLLPVVPVLKLLDIMALVHIRTHTRTPTHSFIFPSQSIRIFDVHM